MTPTGFEPVLQGWKPCVLDLARRRGQSFNFPTSIISIEFCQKKFSLNICKILATCGNLENRVRAPLWNTERCHPSGHSPSYKTVLITSWKLVLHLTPASKVFCPLDFGVCGLFLRRFLDFWRLHQLSPKKKTILSHYRAKKAAWVKAPPYKLMTN